MAEQRRSQKATPVEGPTPDISVEPGNQPTVEDLVPEAQGQGVEDLRVMQDHRGMWFWSAMGDGSGVASSYHPTRELALEDARKAGVIGSNTEIWMDGVTTNELPPMPPRVDTGVREGMEMPA